MVPWRRATWPVLILLGLGPAARAQSRAATGAIEGTFLDEAGVALSGAAVALRNTATNLERLLTTDGDGRFQAVLLPPGPYRITVSLPGFASLVREGLDVSAGQILSLRLNLKASAVQEKMVESGAVPLIETSRVEGGDRIDPRSIRGLPSDSRDFLDFATLAAGVGAAPGPDGEGLSINGQRGNQARVIVDGGDFNSPFFSGPRGGHGPAFTLNPDAVREVVVVAEGAGAEFGRAASGFVNAVTRSGTNELRGTAHLHLKDDGLSARARTGRPAPDDHGPKPELDRQQAGFTLGGPLRKDRLFYFLAAGAQRSRSTKQTDPARIEPRAVDFFASLGSPEENGPIVRTSDARSLLARLDWQASARHLLTLRYHDTWSERKNGSFDVDSWGRSANGIEGVSTHAVTASAISSLSPSLLNELRIQYGREHRRRPYDGPTMAGRGRPLPDTAFDFDRAYRFGMPFFLPMDHRDESLELSNSLSVLEGRHSIRAGFEYRRAGSSQTFTPFANGRFIFTSTAGFLSYARNPRYVECSDGSASETGTCPPATAVVGPVLVYLQQAGVGGLTAEQAGSQSIPGTEPAVFIEDRWQPSRKLTLQCGLRWEAQIQPDPLTPPKEAFFAPFIGETREGVSFPSDGTIPSDYSMFQPRVGIAWDPKGDGKTVVRLNGGIFYSRVPGLLAATARSTNGSRGQIVFRSSALAADLGPVPPYPELIPPSEVARAVRPDVFVFSTDFRNARTYAASLAVEREIAHDLALRVQYDHAKSVHLSRLVDRNDRLLGDGGAPAPWGTGLPPAGANGIRALATVESSAKSLYRGLTVALRKRWSRRYQLQVHYTLSEHLSDDDSEDDPFSFRYAKVTDLAAEYGPSDRERRHRVNGWLLWRAPGRLDVGLRYAYRSAQPKSIRRDGRDARTPQDRVSPDGNVVPRNQGRKDNAFSSLDLRISRELRVGKAGGIEPIVEVFNLLNSKNFRSPEVTSLVFSFDGALRSGLGEARQVQLGLRFVW